MNETYNTLEEEERQQMDSSEESARIINRRSKNYKVGRILLIGTCCLALLAILIGVVAKVSSRRRPQSYSSKLSAAPNDKLIFAEVDEIDCIGDKIHNEQPLDKNEYICSSNGKYAVGLDANGDFVWLDMEAKLKTTYYDHEVSASADPAYFMMEEDGTILVYQPDGKTVWKEEPKLEIKHSEKCLDNKFSCPFLQLHDDGVMVLRWRDGSDKWAEHNLYKAYGTGSVQEPASVDDTEEKVASTTPSVSETTSTKTLNRVPTYECVGERLQNQVPLEAGDFICSANNDYVVGITEAGHFAWVNVTSGDVVPYYNHTAGKKLPASFVLNAIGTMVVAKEDLTTVWKQQAPADRNITFHEKCLGDINCPYLHLHNDGVLVLNWVDEASGSMNEHNVKKVYTF